MQDEPISKPNSNNKYVLIIL